MKVTMDGFLRFGVFFLAAASVGATIWLGFLDKENWITAALAIGLTIFVFLSQFKRFKGLGFEGELWEKEMEQAADIRRRLSELYRRTAEFLFLQLGPGARWEHIPEPDKFRIVEQISSDLSDLGLPQDEIDVLKRPWHKYVMGDLARPISNRINDASKDVSRLERDSRRRNHFGVSARARF